MTPIWVVMLAVFAVEVFMALVFWPALDLWFGWSKEESDAADDE